MTARLLVAVALGVPGLAGAQDFVLGSQGCPMAHCDVRMSDLARAPVPAGDVGVVWRSDPGKGSRSGIGCSANGAVAACSFNDEAGENLVVYGYGGERLWSSGTLLNGTASVSAPAVSEDGHVIAADDTRIVRFDAAGGVVWNTPTPGGRPISPVFAGDGLVVIATFLGPLSAYDVGTGALVAQHTLRRDGASGPTFSTTNTPCVRGSRVYVVAEKDGFDRRHEGRLVALDVDRAGIREAWHVDFGAPSGTSPLLIGDVVYFGGARPSPGAGAAEEPTLFAVRDRGATGEVVWSRPIAEGLAALASFAQDPRGGLWFFPAGDPHLIRVAEADGSEIERIDLDAVVGLPGLHVPGSVMTIAGSASAPVMLVSAKTYFGKSFVVALDLAARAAAWKAQISGVSSINRRSTSGQFPIVLGPGGPRVVFSTWDLGVFAVGARADPLRR
jgi:hypothetical protein